MFCPKCKSEFENGLTQCGDCGVSLVESLPKLSEVKWEVVKQYSGYIPAEMAKGALEGNSIPAFIKGDFISTAYGVRTWDVAGGKAVLFVPKEDLEKAKTIIDEMTVDEP